MGVGSGIERAHIYYGQLWEKAANNSEENTSSEAQEQQKRVTGTEHSSRSKAQEAQAIVTGVYAVADNTVYVTLRLIRADDSLVISSFDYSLPKNANITSLLELDSFLTYWYFISW